MAYDADTDWHTGLITRPVRVLFTLFMSGVAGVIGCAAAFILDLPVLWAVVTVCAPAACAAVHEWEHTATLTLAQAKPRRA
jgi:hypothetical protein